VKFYLYKYIFVIFGIIISCPLYALASGINYGKIISQSADSFVLQYGNTETPDFYNCAVSALSCSDIGKTAPLAIENQTANANARFTFSTTSTSKKNIITRSFYLKDNATGKIYSRSYKLDFWDMLGDENTISSISPDEKRMVYTDDSSGYPTLYQLDLTALKGNKFKGAKVFSKAFSINGFTLASQNDLYFIANKDGPYEWNLYKYNFTTKVISLIANNASYAFRIRKFGNGFIFFAIQGASSFPVFYNEETNQVEKFSGITADNSPSAVNSRVMSFGGNMHGVLMTPQNFNKNAPHELVIWLHGGPYRQTSLGYDSYASYAVYDLILNEMAKNNIAVLKLDYSGSYGYGGAFAKSIKGNVGNKDVSDVMNALSSIKKGMVISDIYLMGNSYGGYLSLRSIVAYPKQFDGAISINGVTDWATMLSDLGNSIFNLDFNGKPNKSNKKLYDKASIISRISNLANQKIILIQAQADKTIPPSQADLLYKVLQDKGKNVLFYPYADEDHIFKKTASIEGICKNVFTALSISLDNNCNFE